jgi:SAM-dependent methyltransferase
VTWRRRVYERRYRLGAVPWDTGITPPEVVMFLEGGTPPSGRALDLGCGTGTNVRYLAGRGFEVVGVDLSRLAVEQARAKLADVPGVTILEGDVSRLSALGIEGLFDYILDIGCFHGLRRLERERYANEVAGVARRGATLMMFAWARRGLGGLFTGVRHGEIRRRFEPGFDLVRVLAGTDPPGAAWYYLRRR